MMKKIKYLYWWNSKPNAGDAASVIVVEWMLGYKIKFGTANSVFKELKRILRVLIEEKRITFWQAPIIKGHKTLYAIGSIIDNINSNAIIWGSGLGRSWSRIKGHPIIYAVRGKLTLKNLPDSYDKSKIAIGDPAMLLPLIIRNSNQIQIKHKIGIIPHFEDYEYFTSKYADRYHFIDIRTKDLTAFIKDILSCEYILSSAMHGIIISQSYGKPALWIRRLSMNVGDFKFHDYFSSVDLPLYDGFANYEDILKSEENILQLFKDNKDKAYVENKIITNIQKNLINVFRAEY